jgi:hypothetical protein
VGVVDQSLARGKRRIVGGTVRKHLLPIVACAASLLLVCSARAATSVNLDFNGSGNTLAATGFGAAYNLNPAGFNVGGGVLTTQTLPGDTFGQYEAATDPDRAHNQFYSIIDPLGQTTVEAHVTVSGLNSNFHGGGIWMGTDEDHYARLGVFHNTFVSGGPIAVELLRENEDRWSGATPPGQGDDIVSQATGISTVSPMTTPIPIILRLTRNGNTVTGSYSLNNGTTFLPAGTFAGFALPGDPQGLGSNTIESPVSFKVGIYAVGGGNPMGSYAFDSFTAQSVPEPAALGALAMVAGVFAARRRAS